MAARDLLAMPALPGIPIGMGADFGSAEQMALYAKAPSIGVLQPDVCMLGGLSEAKRALADAGRAKKTAAPHTPFIGPAALASLHMLAVDGRPGLLRHRRGRGLDGPLRLRPHLWKPELEFRPAPVLATTPIRASLNRYDYAKE